MKTLYERFCEKYVVQPNGCWLWSAAQTVGGYGKFKVRGSSARAHRFSYEHASGSIPDGMFVCHRCDEPRCVNPDHLFLGSPKENMLDMVAKGRQPLGERNGRAKLTLRQVLNIRGSSGKTYNDMAKTYDVSAEQISRIVRRKKWASV